MLPEGSKPVDEPPIVGSVADDVETGPLDAVGSVVSLLPLLAPGAESDVGLELAPVADTALSVSAGTPSSLQPKSRAIAQTQLRFDIGLTVVRAGHGVHLLGIRPPDPHCADSARLRSSLRAAHDSTVAVLQEHRIDFTKWCRDELFTPEIRQATRLINRYCDLQLAAMYRDLDLGAMLREPKKASDITAQLGFVDNASIALRDALRRMGERSGTVRVEGKPLEETFTHVDSPNDPTQELADVRGEVAALGSDYTAATDFLDFGRDSFVKSLKDDPDYMDKLLSGRMKDFAELWHRATNADPLQDLHGAMGARVLERLLDGGTVLEIGGGTGNGARHLFGVLEKRGALDKVGKYIFTDISMRFVLASKHEFEKRYPSIDWGWGFFDLNKPFEAQKIAPESVDVLYAVNAAHVAKDIVGFLRGCREALRPGGHIVFAERIRMKQYEMAPREFTLNLSVYHRSAPQKADYRPMHCYLHPDNWRAVIKKAGFASCDILPDLDSLEADFPDQYAAVIVARK